MASANSPPDSTGAFASVHKSLQQEEYRWSMLAYQFGRANAQTKPADVSEKAESKKESYHAELQESEAEVQNVHEAHVGSTDVAEEDSTAASSEVSEMTGVDDQRNEAKPESKLGEAAEVADVTEVEAADEDESMVAHATGSSDSTGAFASVHQSFQHEEYRWSLLAYQFGKAGIVPNVQAKAAEADVSEKTTSKKESYHAELQAEVHDAPGAHVGSIDVAEEASTAASSEVSEMTGVDDQRNEAKPEKLKPVEADVLSKAERKKSKKAAKKAEKAKQAEEAKAAQATDDETLVASGSSNSTSAFASVHKSLQQVVFNPDDYSVDQLANYICSKAKTPKKTKKKV